MAKCPSSGNVSVMASDPFRLQSLLVISLLCYCCCWMTNRLEVMLIIKEIPLYMMPQLSFIYLLQISVKDCSVYDPVFTSGEMDVLRELGMTVLTENEVSFWFFILETLQKAEMKISCHFRQFFLICLSYCYFSGGETFVNQTHYLLSNALWKSPVQQPSLEELEYTVSSSDQNNWKQLHQYEGKVCTSRELTECCMETCKRRR